MDLGRRIFVISHPRSGTHLTIDLLRKQFKLCQAWRLLGDYLDHVYLELDRMRPTHPWCINRKNALKLLRRAGRPIVKTHLQPGFELLEGQNLKFASELYRDADRLYVVRDGRDVLCSAHLWLQESDPSARCSISEFLRQEKEGINRVQFWAKHVSSWQEEPSVHMFSYEQILRDPRGTIKLLGKILHMEPSYVEPLLPRRLRGTWHRRFIRLLQPNPESTAVLGRYKKQQPAKWVIAFSKADREFFHEHAGNMLIKLQYEDSDAWVDGSYSNIQ